MDDHFSGVSAAKSKPFCTIQALVIKLYNNSFVSFQRRICSIWGTNEEIGSSLLSDCNYTKDIQSGCRFIIAYFNKVLCLFSHLDAISQKELFECYCSNFYGCEL
jgi:hypothetical protein